MNTRTDDVRRRTIGSTVRWIVTGLVVLFGAYVCGRALGIVLDVDPHVTEVAAIVVGVAAVWTAAGRRRRSHELCLATASTQKTQRDRFRSGPVQAGGRRRGAAVHDGVRDLDASLRLEP